MSDHALTLLVERWLDGDGAASDMAELRRRLEGDAGQRAEARTMVATALALRACHHPAARTAALVRELITTDRSTSRRDLRIAVQERVVYRRWRRRLSYTCAALLLLGLVVGIVARLAMGDGHGAILRAADGRETRVADGTTIAAPARQDATLTLDDGTALTIAGGSTVRVEQLAPPRRLHLVAGRLQASVAPQPATAPLVIAAADARATVLGTRFRLELLDDVVGLAVEVGRVRLESHGTVLEVGDGQQALAGADRGPALNRAYHRPASASSVHNNRHDLYDPAFANDGVITTLWANGVDAPNRQGQTGSFPWWQVDLGKPHRIEAVELVARQDVPLAGSADRTHAQARDGFVVQAALRSDFSDAVVIARKGTEPFPVKGTWRAAVTDRRAWRHLRVVLTSGATHFNFAEFRAYGIPVMGSPPGP